MIQTNSDLNATSARLTRPFESSAGWHLTDLAVVLACLGGLQAVQLYMVRSGKATGFASGFGLLLLLYFPTILTTSLVLLLGTRRGMSLRKLGFVRPKTWRPALRAFAAALVAGPAYGILLLSLSTVVGSHTPDVILGAMAPPMLLSAAALWALPLVVSVPLLEEIIFRGLLFRGLRLRVAVIPALLITGLLFGAFHMELTRLVPLAIAGAAFAYAYERSGSIWPAIAAHAGLNGVWVAVILLRPLL